MSCVPLDFIARLAVLVPRPRVNLVRYHGVLAPNQRWRAEVTPSARGRGRRTGTAQRERPAIERHAAMTWARWQKRVFGIDVESCVRCGAAVRVIASIEEPTLIERILEHVRGKGKRSTEAIGPPSTGPPVSACVARPEGVRKAAMEAAIKDRQEAMQCRRGWRRDCARLKRAAQAGQAGFGRGGGV